MLSALDRQAVPRVKLDHFLDRLERLAKLTKDVATAVAILLDLHVHESTRCPGF